MEKGAKTRTLQVTRTDTTSTQTYTQTHIQEANAFDTQCLAIGRVMTHGALQVLGFQAIIIS